MSTQHKFIMKSPGDCCGFNFHMLVIPFLFILPLAFIGLHVADGATIKESVHAGVELEITYPDSVVAGRQFSVSIFIENTGWEEKQNVILIFSNDVTSITPISNSDIKLEKLSSNGSYGSTLDFEISKDAPVGTHFINLQYRHTIADVETPSPDPSLRNIAIPILIRQQPTVTIATTSPESIFPNAEFSFEVELESEDIDITDVTVQIIPPKDIEFRGETLHTFSSIDRNIPISISSQLSVPQSNISTEHKLPFQIIVEYINDLGEEKTDSSTVSLLLRPRTFMELTNDGGIWIGGIFLAPYVSIGTIVGIPLGTIIGIMFRRRERRKRKRRGK